MLLAHPPKGFAKPGRLWKPVDLIKSVEKTGPQLRKKPKQKVAVSS